jgi:hypothetical protein
MERSLTIRRLDGPTTYSVAGAPLSWLLDWTGVGARGPSLPCDGPILTIAMDQGVRCVRHLQGACAAGRDPECSCDETNPTRSHKLLCSIPLWQEPHVAQSQANPPGGFQGFWADDSGGCRPSVKRWGGRWRGGGRVRPVRADAPMCEQSRGVLVAGAAVRYRRLDAPYRSTGLGPDQPV